MFPGTSESLTVVHSLAVQHREVAFNESAQTKFADVNSFIVFHRLLYIYLYIISFIRILNIVPFNNSRVICKLYQVKLTTF